MTTRSDTQKPESPDPAPLKASGLKGSGVSGADGLGLRELAERSESLLGDLSSSRDDLIAPVDLNRILRQLLTNQAALLRALSTPSGPLPAVVPSRVVPARTVPSERVTHESEPHQSEPSRAQAFLGVDRSIDEGEAQRLVASFDHRDRDFAAGLEKLNRWTDGAGGTPFQVREDVAFLNVGSSEDGAKRYEKNLMERMGFNRRLGRLAISGLLGEIVVYERS